MKVTKFVHSCLLVETPERTAVFDPGAYSAEALGQALDTGAIARLDDIFVTHAHYDHCDADLIRRLVARFPDARVTGTAEVVAELGKAGIKAGDQAPEGVEFFEAPHERLHPPRQAPQNIGIHYLGKLSDPGDSHSFDQTKAVLALPVQAPWGSNVRAFSLALELKPRHVLPVHDWHWRDEAREGMYDMFERSLGEQGITFHKLKTGQPFDIAV
ncbi:MAG TPA: MBL fold metallo-hydrolase [Candidatus Saccharimonadales bacterium]|nr:MBL fold metallo-hydrolase [Candidatus Saccharimonadales bacterium]